MSSAYQIQDEPRGRTNGGFIVNPIWPLFAFMLAGTWLAALLFTINAWFLRGPTWRREIALVIAMLAGVPAILFAIVSVLDAGYLPDGAAKYAILLVVVWKLSVMYWVFFLQQSSYALYEYFQDQNRSRQIPYGVILLAIGYMVRSEIVSLFDSVFWQLTVS